MMNFECLMLNCLMPSACCLERSFIQLSKTQLLTVGYYIRPSILNRRKNMHFCYLIGIELVRLLVFDKDWIAQQHLDGS
jgi:hypothetical protein